MEVFGLMFAVSFIALLTTLVVLHICKRIDKNNQSNVAKGSKHLSWISTMLGKQESSRRESYGFTKEKAARISLNTQKAYTLNYDTGSGKDYSVESNLKQDSDGNIEFIDCKWIDESWMKREVNETQEKWKESLPKHKTRIKARNKRKQRNKR